MREILKEVIECLCGIWALGLGARLTLELVLCDGYIHIPKHPLNIFFDFGMLAILGLVVTIVIIHELIATLKREKIAVRLPFFLGSNPREAKRAPKKQRSDRAEGIDKE